MNEKIIVSFMQIKNVVVAEVLEMPEKYRGTGDLTKFSGGEYRVASYDSPSLTNLTCYLPGSNKKYDNILASNAFGCEEQAKEAIAEWTKLIHEVNEQDAGQKVEASYDVKTIVAE